RLDDEGLKSFMATVVYYSALIDVAYERYPQALAELRDVIEHQQGELAGHATELAKRIEQQLQRARPRISIPSPVGPLEFDINQNVGRAYVNWEAIRDLYLGLEYDYSYTQLGHKPFISSNRATPVISKTWRGAPSETEPQGETRARTDIYYSYDDRNYLDE